MRRFVFVVAKLVFIAALAALGWMALHRDGIDRSNARAAGGGDATRPLPATSSPGGAMPPGSPSNQPGDDWMQPYRGMTLDQAFEAVATRVRFEPYIGVQRGARGTARAQAGNSIDHALLLAAVLRAAGYEVRFARGSLSAENASALLRGLYPPRIPTVTLDSDYRPYQASADAELLALVKDHYWIEVNQGSTWLPLDPSFPRAKIGEAYATAADRFAEPPADLYQRLEFAWKIDTQNRPAQQVARWSGTVADLGLQPISLVVDAIPGSPKQQPPARPSAGGMFGGALAGAPQAKPAAEQPSASQAPNAIRYVREVETDTRPPATGNVAFMNQPGSVVQREWIEMRLAGPGGFNRTIQRTLYESDEASATARAEHRRYTILVVPGPVSRAYVHTEIARARDTLKLDQWRDELTRLRSQTPSQPSAQANLQRARQIETAVGKTAGYLMTLDFAATSDEFTDRIAYPNGIAVVRPIPRILVVSNETRADKSDELSSSTSLDLRLDEVQAYPYPGFPASATSLFLAARGMQESVLEGQLVARWTGREAVGTAAVMAEAASKNVQLLSIDGEDRTELESSRGMTPRARAEIEAAVNAGHDVIVPAQAITIGGRPRWGWWDVDPSSGAVVGVMEGGQHQALQEYSLSSSQIGINDDNAKFLGCIVGANSTMFFVCAKLLETGTVTPQLIAAVKNYVDNGACTTMCPAKAEATGSAKLKVVGDCLKFDKLKRTKELGDVKFSIGAKAALNFCAKYNEGFKCAGGLILAGLKGQMPDVELAVGAKVEIQACGVGR